MTSVVVYVGGEKSQRLPLQRYILDVFGRERVSACLMTVPSKKTVLLSELLFQIKWNLLPLLKKAMPEKDFDMIKRGLHVHVTSCRKEP